GYTPDVVLLHIGTNDAIWDADGLNPDPEPSLAAFADTTWGEIDSIIQTIMGVNSSAHIFVAQIIPVWSKPENQSIQDRIDALNLEIGFSAPSLATVVDFSGLTPTGAMLADSFHPNAAGEEFMANQWFTAMESTGALSSIPEPSTCALIVGVSTLLCAAFSRRRGKAAPAKA
ncbi:MAG: GDSL-type esterase/lipase family protein, partial [Opitutaceae bacterium]